MLMLIIFLAFLVTAGAFGYTMYHEPRSLWAGATCTAFLAMSVAFILSILFHYSEVIMAHQPVHILLSLLAMVVVLVGLMLPFVLILAFLYNGIKILFKEGFKPHNLLSLFFAFLCIGYLFVWPLVGDLSNRNIWRYAYEYLGTLALYFIGVMMMYTLTLWLNLLHFKRNKLDYIVVLGAGLNGTEVTLLLAARIDRAIKVYQKNPHMKLIMSGGKGPDEVIAEAEAMKNYAVKQGVPAEDILIENKSTTTYENILFSHKLMKPDAKFGIATNSYHVYRALVIAKRQGLKCVGFGAKTRWYFTLNAFMREYIAYLQITYKLQLSVVTLIGLMYMVFALIKF